MVIATFKQNCIWRLAALNHSDPLESPERHTWPFRRASLRDTMLSYGCSFDMFYHWPVMQDAFISGATPPNIATWNMLDEQHKVVSIDPKIGGLATSDVPTLPNGGTGTFARQALACQLLEKHFANKASGSDWQPHSWGNVFEFGGGFGALAYILKRLSFTGKHTIFDFPECSIIQEWYLSTLAVSNIELINELYFNLYPHIFISVSALDEAKPEERLAILEKVHAEYYFIWYHKTYHVDNSAWFSDFFSNRRITYYPSPHPNQEILIAER